MRTRRWVIVLAILLLSLAAVFSYRRLGQQVNKELHILLQERVQPLLARGWSIDSVKVQWGAVHLLGVLFRSPDSPYELHVRDVRIGYSFFQLVRHGFKPKSLPQEILLTEPELILHFGKRRTPSVSEVDSTQLVRMPGGLDFVRTLVISNGKIIYADTSQKRFEVVREVSGYVYALPEGQALARLAGVLRGSNKIGVEVLAKANFSQQQLDTLRVRFLDVEVGGSFPFLLPPYLDVDRGRFSGELWLVERPSSPYGFDLNGALQLTKATVRLKGARIWADSLDFRARVRHWNVEIQHGYAILNGSPVELSGKVYDVLNPRFEVRLLATSFDVGRFQERLGFDFPLQPRGTVQVDLRLLDDYRNPIIAGQLRADTLRMDGRTLTEVGAELALQDSVMAVRGLRARLGSFALNGSMWLDFARSAQPVAVHLAGVGSLPLLLGLDNALARNDSVGLELRGRLSGGAVSGALRIRLAEQADSTHYHLAGRVRVTNREFSWALQAQHGNFGGRGLVKFTDGDSSAIAYVELRAHRVEELFAQLGVLRVPLSRFHSWGMSLQFAGEPRQLQSEMRLEHGLGLDRRPVLVGLGTLEPFKPGRLAGTYQLVYKPSANSSVFGDLTFNLADSAGKRRLTGQLELGDRLKVFYSSEGSQGEIDATLDQVPLEQLLGTGEDVLRGVVDGQIRLVLRDSAWLAAAKVSGTHIFSHNVGPFGLGVRAGVRNHIFNIDSLWLTYRDGIWLQGKGAYHARSGTVEAWARGDSIQLLDFLSAFGVGDSLVDAICSFWARAKGSVQSPLLEGELLAANGRFWREPFDLLRVAFGPEEATQPDSGWALHVGHMLLTRTGVYEFEGDGRLPLTRTGQLALNLQGKIDVLRVVADLQGFLQDPVSQGQLKLRIGGSWNQPRVLSAELRMAEGATAFSSILPPATKVRGLVRLEGGNFLHLINLSGKMGGEPFRISTVASVDSVCDCHLEPFRLPGIGLTIGIFQLESGPNGVPINLYGLQEKGDFGKYEFLGLNSGEKFWFAGPWEKPVIRGSWKLRDVQFQYPFVEGATGKRSWFLDMLNRAEWNLRLLPVKDVRYVRYIPSALDNVYVNLLIDERGQGVLLTGCPAEGTFRLVGRVESTRGMVEYLDMNFQVENAGAEFDRHSLYPVVWGRARTTVTDTTGIPANIYLTVQTEDMTEERGLGDDVRNRQRVGRWNQIRFKLSSDNPNLGTTEGQILGALGYSSRNLRKKAAEVVGISADNMLFRPLYRPVERSLAKVFGLDMVRFSSRFARNFIEWNLSNQPVSSWYLLRSTRWQVGKYLTNNLFLNYTGEIEAALPYQYHRQGLGLRHTLGLEYRISPDLVLEMIYDYDSLLLHQKSDRRILLRHYFPF